MVKIEKDKLFFINKNASPETKAAEENKQSANIKIDFVGNQNITNDKGLIVQRANSDSTVDESQGVRKVEPPISLKISNADLSAYKTSAVKSALELSSRASVDGQYLKWIDNLPKTELKNLDNLYNTANSAKVDGSNKLVVVGMGGSRNPTEAMLDLFGINQNVSFYSGIDDISFNRFVNKLDLDKTKFMIVSKSGTTLETSTAYAQLRKKLQEHFGKEDVSDSFIAVTDASEEKSPLRKAVNNGEIKYSGLVHDDVGGRFSIFDDATVLSLAYLGADKEDVRSLLKSSVSAQKEFLNPDMDKNDALKLAAFNVDCQKNGKPNANIEYFGDFFNGLSSWEKQLKNESLKHDLPTETNIGPEFLHYNAESDLADSNKNSFYSFVNVKTDNVNANSLYNGAKRGYKAQHPVSEIELKDLSPETIARFVELKHFETIYTGMMLRKQTGTKVDSNDVLPELTQNNVEKYKKEVKIELKNNSKSK